MNKSAKDYIKTIYILKHRLKRVHSVDIAREMGFSKASVSIAMANLRQQNIIEMKKGGEIDFTVNGENIAADIYERQRILCGFLQAVAGVDEMTAEGDAGRMEHYISDSTFAGIRRFFNMQQGIRERQV